MHAFSIPDYKPTKTCKIESKYNGEGYDLFLEMTPQRISGTQSLAFMYISCVDTEDGRTHASTKFDLRETIQEPIFNASEGKL